MSDRITVVDPLDFITLFKKVGKVSIKDYRIFGDCHVTKNDVSCDSIEFTNCEFTEDFRFSDVILKFGIKFINCHFNSDLVFVKCSITGYDQVFNLEGYSLLLINCTIKNTVRISECRNIDRGIRLAQKTNCNRIILNANTITNGSISFSNSTIQDQCDIEHNVVSDSISLESSTTVECKVRIWNNTCAYLSFLNSEFKEDIHVGGGTMKRVTFNNGIFHDDFNLGPFKSDEQLTIIGAEFKTKFSVKYNDTTNQITGGCPKIYLSDSSFGIGLNVVGTNNLAKLPLLSSVMIISNEKLIGDISFRNFDVEEFSFHGNNTKAKIKLHNVQPLKLGFFEFTNSSKIQFFDFSPYYKGISVFEVSQSNLGSTEFYNAFLNKFTEIRITNSVVSDIITSNIRWFDPKLLEPEKHLGNSEKNFFYRNNRETFRQLKYAMEKQGNKIYALQFKSFEMQAYKNELRYKPDKKWYHELPDKVILYLNQISNSHGINPVKPFVWILSFTVVFYWLIVISISPNLTWLPSLQANDWITSVKEFAKYSSAMPKMLNPLFVFDKTFIGFQSEHFSTSLWELLHRVFLSYLLFQFVSAFRKFVK